PGPSDSEEPGIHIRTRWGYGFRTRRFASLRNDELTSRRLVAGLAALGPAGVGFHILLGGRVDQRQHLVLDRLDRGHLGVPFGAVPFDERHAAVAVMISAAELHRRGKAFHAELL